MDKRDILAELHEALESAMHCGNCVSSCYYFLKESIDVYEEPFFGPADCEQIMITCARAGEALDSIVPTLKSSIKLIIDHAADTQDGLKAIVAALFKAEETAEKVNEKPARAPAAQWPTEGTTACLREYCQRKAAEKAARGEAVTEKAVEAAAKAFTEFLDLPEEE